MIFQVWNLGNASDINVVGKHFCHGIVRLSITNSFRQPVTRSCVRVVYHSMGGIVKHNFPPGDDALAIFVLIAPFPQCSLPWFSIGPTTTAAPRFLI